MKTGEFREYKERYASLIRQVWANSKSKIFFESAFPAYSNPNALIHHLFWQRIKIAIDYVEQRGPYDAVIDFGCGSGVMLPFLAWISGKVVAMDVDFSPINQIKSHTTFPDNVEFQDAREIYSDHFPAGGFDVVLALDVLEHVDNLEETVSQICRALKPGGYLIISAPTENVFYKIGRRVAGSDYSGEFHERGSREIKKILSSKMEVKKVATLYPLVPLFEIYAGTVQP